MTEQADKPLKIGTEITVRISLTFQEAPDVHTLLAMTPVRERGKLVRLALERYIVETGHPAGDVEQQIIAISAWLRSRTAPTEITMNVTGRLEVDRATDDGRALWFHNVQAPLRTSSDLAPAGVLGGSGSVSEEVKAPSSPIKRWLQT